MALRSELVVSILTEWLPVKATALVDSACCCQCYREIWLRILKHWFIFPVISQRSASWRSLAKWLSFREVRTKKLELYSIRNVELSDIAILARLLATSAHSFRSVTFLNYCSTLWPIIQEYCTQLTELEVYDHIGFSFWNIVRNNPHLSKLKLKRSCDTRYVAPPPKPLPISELTIRMDPSFISYLLPQLPKLSHLVLYAYSREVPCLATCDRLVYLHLREAHLTETDLVTLVGSLKAGLQRFVFPFVADQPMRPKGYYRNLALLAIWPKHAATLECLEICFRKDWRIAELINSCVVLHTLVIRSSGHKSSWYPPKLRNVLNPSIRTLHVDNCDVDTFVTMKSNFTNVTTLGFMGTNRSLVYNHICDILSVCNKVRAVSTDFHVPVELRKGNHLVRYSTYVSRDLF